METKRNKQFKPHSVTDHVLNIVEETLRCGQVWWLIVNVHRSEFHTSNEINYKSWGVCTSWSHPAKCWELIWISYSTWVCPMVSQSPDLDPNEDGGFHLLKATIKRASYRCWLQSRCGNASHNFMIFTGSGFLNFKTLKMSIRIICIKWPCGGV